MKVRVPTPLQSYTAGRPAVDASGSTVDEVLQDLDRRYPGIRFRMIDEQDQIRPHIKVFLNGDQISGLTAPVAPSDEIAIVQSFSGG